MGKIELVMPKMGESVAEATIIKWLVEEGANIEAEESVLEIATDKVDSEIPAPEDGVLVQKLFNEGDVVKVGEPIAIIEVEGAGDATAGSAPAPEVKGEPAPVEKVAETAPEPVAAVATNGATAAATEVVDIPRSGGNGKFYSPLVRSIAVKEGITAGELEALTGSGLGGRVTKKDVLAYLDNRGSAPAEVATAPAPAKTVQPATSAPSQKVEITAPAVSGMEGDEIIEMDRMRKLIADHMVMSKHVSPHVTSYVEADVTNLVNWRNKHKNAFLQREGEKLTFTPIFIEAIVKAIKDLPMVNVSVDGNNIIKRKNINIGMATALPSGNLIVPVIRKADQLNLLGLAKQVNDLANRARNNQLNPDEIQDGTFTVTNVGTFGNVMGTPIINQPQAAILAVGAIRKKPAVIETPYGDTIGIRQMMYLSHSYDHRVVDGALGGAFVRKVADYLEAFDVEREI